MQFKPLLRSNAKPVTGKMTQRQSEDHDKLDGRNLEEIQAPEAVAERDIDLLLIEELHVDSNFRSWFYELVWETGNHAVPFLGAWHSLTHPEHGESDIVVLVEGVELTLRPGDANIQRVLRARLYGFSVSTSLCHEPPPMAQADCTFNWSSRMRWNILSNR